MLSLVFFWFVGDGVNGSFDDGVCYDVDGCPFSIEVKFVVHGIVGVDGFICCGSIVGDVGVVFFCSNLFHHIVDNFYVEVGLSV